jgi:hypothetical protein
MFETSEVEVEVDADALEASLTKRLRARAARADSAVQITPEVLAEWVREELEALMTEIAWFHTLARARGMN